MKRIAILAVIAGAALLLAPSSASAQVVYCDYVCDVYSNTCIPNPNPEAGAQCIQELGWCWMRHGEYPPCHGPSRPPTIPSKWRIVSIEIERTGLPVIRTDASSAVASIEVKPQSTVVR